MERGWRRIRQQRNREWKFARWLKENWIAAALLPRVWPISSKVALLMTYETTPEKKECRQIEIERTKTWFTRIDTIVYVPSFVVVRVQVFHGCITFWYESFIMTHVSGSTLILPIKGWEVIFFYFLGEKSPARVAKVPAVAGSRLLFWTLQKCFPSILRFNFPWRF